MNPEDYQDIQASECMNIQSNGSAKGKTLFEIMKEQGELDKKEPLEDEPEPKIFTSISKKKGG